MNKSSQNELTNVVLYGGGLDSTVVAMYLSVNDYENMHLLHINYGQKAFVKEREAAIYWSKRLGCKLLTGDIDMSYSKAAIMTGDVGTCQKDNKLELRNPLLLTYAASMLFSMDYDYIQLALGFHEEPEGTAFNDAKVGYLKHLSDALNMASGNEFKLKIITPFSQMSRQNIIELGLCLDKTFVENTYTCYEAEECGVCLHCQEKKRILENIGSKLK